MQEDKRPLDKFLYHFLSEKYKDQEVIAAWGYNILEALEEYSFDGDCYVFLLVLKGELAPEILKDQM